MGVLNKLSRIFNPAPAATTPAHQPKPKTKSQSEEVVVTWPPKAKSDNGAPSAAKPAASATTTEPKPAPAPSTSAVATLTDDDVLGSDSSPSRSNLSAPRNKQELIDELRNNYAEVIELVRKVNTHLDDQAKRIELQEQRSERLLQIAESIPAALSPLNDIREQNERMLKISGDLLTSINDLNKATSTSQSEVTSALKDQAKSAAESAVRVQTLLARGAESQDKAAASIAHMGKHLGSSTERMKALIEHVRQSDQRRDEMINATMKRNQKWTLGALIGCGLAIAAVAAVLVMQTL